MNRDMTKASGVLDAAADYLEGSALMGACVAISHVYVDALRRGPYSIEIDVTMARDRAVGVFQRFKPEYLPVGGVYWWELNFTNHRVRIDTLRRAADIARSQGD